MMNDWSPTSGDLIYVPSEVNLKRFDPTLGSTAVTEYLKLDSPVTVLVSEMTGESVEVVYRGSKWTVELKHAYPVHL